jgi:hypothetical protein
MKPFPWKKRPKTRPPARLFIEELETRMAPAGNLLIRGAQDLRLHDTLATEENLGAFELRTVQRYSITLGANGIGFGGSINWNLGYVPGYADNATLAPATGIFPSSGTIENSGIGARVSVTLTFNSPALPNGTYHGELSASGGSGVTAGLYFFTFSVFSSPDFPPTVTPPSNQSTLEGASTSFNLGSFADPDGGPWTVDVNWNDGSPNTSFPVSSAGSLGNQGHTYADEGLYVPAVKVTDSTGLFVSSTFEVSVADQPLTATGGFTVTATEGNASASQTVASFTDANLMAPLSDFTAMIDWGDGTAPTTGTITQPGGIGTSFAVSGSHTYAEEGASYTITVNIADVGGSTDIATSAATVSDAALTASITAVSATEGINLSGQVASFTDANPSAPLTDFTTGTGGASINWGDGTPATAGPVTQPNGVGTAFVVSGSHTYVEEGSFTITVNITDKGGSTATAVPTGPNATVADAALTANGTAVHTTEGFNFSGQVASFTDANLSAPLSDFTASIDWGDSKPATTGTGTQPGGTGTAFVVSGSHIYLEEGSFTVSVSIKDTGGSMASPSSTATVVDATLTATGGFVVSAAAIGNHTVATFTDANPAAPVSDFTALINWGDSTPATVGTVTQPGGVGTDFVAQGSHTYSAVTTYSFPISVSISDKGGSTAMAMSTASASFIVQGYPSPVTSPATGNFSVTALDVNGNKAPGYTGTVKFTSSSTKGDFPPNYTFTAGDAGVHIFSANLRSAGSQSITVTDTLIGTFTGSQLGIMVNPGPAHHLIVARFPVKPTAGVEGSFRITVQDLYGNTINTAPFFTDTVTFTSTDPQAVLPANYTFTAADAGVHDFPATLKTAGSQTIAVQDVTNPTILPNSQPSISVQPATMTQLGVSGFPPFVTAGNPYSVTVAAQDAFGNTIPTYLGTVTFTSSDMAAMLPANYTFTSADAGQHSFMVTLNTLGLQSNTATDTVNSSFTGTESNIKVQTIQPTASVSGPSNGVPSQPLTFTFTASEPGLAPDTTYTFNVLWGDGSSQSFSGTSGTQMTHIYAALGSYAIKVTATDPATPTNPSGNTSLTVSTMLSITTVAMETDPSNSSLTALFVSGTTGDDIIAITPASSSGGVKVGLNFTSYGPFFPTGHVIIYGLSGNDIIKTAPHTFSGVITYVNVPLLILAGDGKDPLNVSGCTANNVLVGGAGTDSLIGGLGRDILIGGVDADTLRAGSGGDILIGGTTIYDNNAAALASVLAEWSRTDIDYLTRIAQINGTMGGGLNGSVFLNASTVQADGSVNNLYGGAGMDWYFKGMTDVLFNVSSGEVVTPI